MPSHLSNPWNNAVAYLEMFRGGNRLGSGSSFFWKVDDRTFLVTNWHNLAGRNPLTDQMLSSAAPDRISFGVFRQVSEPDPSGFYALRFVTVGMRLCDDLREHRWLEHPIFGRRVDVAALDVTQEVQGFQIAHVNVLETDAVLDTVASQDVFVVGFPFGLIANAPAPLWKRGTVALDPTFDADGLPKMLIDTATREGMSGSVVIAKHIIVGRDYLKKDGTKSPLMIYAQCDTVIGIYSGRHYPDLEKAQLGIVWKRRAIEETISGNRRANATEPAAAADAPPATRG